MNGVTAAALTPHDGPAVARAFVFRRTRVTLNVLARYVRRVRPPPHVREWT